MAGSYQHCLNEDGTFRFDLIENMGDAYEACEEMFELIKILKLDLDAAYGFAGFASGPSINELIDQIYKKES